MTSKKAQRKTAPRRAAAVKADSEPLVGTVVAPNSTPPESGAPKSATAEGGAPSLHLRPYQQTARDKFYEGKRRQIRIWHRRAGKDIEALDFAHERAADEMGTYWHLYPTHTQARKAIWNGIDARAGVRFIDRAFPLEERKSTLKQDMTIELNNGSIWQLCGSDRYDSLVGSNPRGVVFSEFALCDPRAWDYVRPIIRENGGWVIFITTYRGRNHAWRMVQKLKNNPDWFVDVRTVDDTTDSDGNPIITAADIQAERDDGMDEALIQQEYYCNPAAAVAGAVYGKTLEQLEADGRTGNFSYDSSAPVYASWSLEFDEQYTVVFWQLRGNNAIIVGSRSFPFEPLTNCFQQVQHAWPWRYCARHIVPPKTSVEVIDQFERFGFVCDVAPPMDNVVSITRDQLATTLVDTAPRIFEGEAENNGRLIEALTGHRFSEARGGQSFTNTPVNSWHKHYARAVEVFCTWRDGEPLEAGSWHPAPSTAEWDRAAI